uniref:EF-hand domain-containing protein n=1 Tax=Haemonchus contortus TaxID=6289 RepID=A0A7I4YYQ7_HAECO
MFAGKNVFTNVVGGMDRPKRRPSQFDRAVHRLYADPGQICANQLADRLFQRLYWAFRTIQFKIFYKNEELDVEEFTERCDVGVRPPPLDELARTTRFNRRWIKYMYAKFKNECPTGRMLEPEFRHVLASIIAPERATDQYFSRLFLAFSSDDKKAVTFQNLIECLSLIQPQTAESNALWTIRIITGCQVDRFAFPRVRKTDTQTDRQTDRQTHRQTDRQTDTQTDRQTDRHTDRQTEQTDRMRERNLFGLNEGKQVDNYEDANKETVQQRATTIFNELDSNGDGIVTLEDMIRFFKSFEVASQVRNTTSSNNTNRLPV